jgi:UDP-2,4-diacetamido-2,4,6-trideoxy-beta-L-altropyranose hydrolase
MKLLVRADASVNTGTGHVMRCLALSQAWQDIGGHAVFAMAESTPAVRERLRDENVESRCIEASPGSDADARETAGLARDIQAGWVVVDGYVFDGAYQRALKASDSKLLFLDDNGHSDHYSADMVLNQNIHADQALYANRSPQTTLLLGLRYALLRREYVRLRDWQRQIPPVARKLLVTMGGSDPGNYTSRVLEALRSVGVDAMKARVVVGGSNPHLAELNKISAGIERVELLINTGDMAELISWADVGVAAAGTVSWEICALGLPALLIPVADNQNAAAQGLGQRMAARILERDVSVAQIADNIRDLMFSASDRSLLSENARALLDTQGAGRVVAEMLAFR